MPPVVYRGRFAPSPTGPLHFGSLVAAAGSYLQTRAHQGQWLVRIEDLDPPRTVPGSAEQILRALEALGFEWHGSVLYQSQRCELYQQALQQLVDQKLAYACSCTRSELEALADGTEEELRYPGYCQAGPRRPGPHAWRFRVPQQPVSFVDGLQGEQHIDLSASSGDFVVKRRDGWFAYQLAVVVDDAAQGITEVVRGVDLLDNTPRQIALQRALGLPSPGYLHLPLATSAGQKLGKSTGAPAVDVGHPVATLWRVLDFLRQQPAPALRNGSLRELWSWALAQWNPDTLRHLQHIDVTP